MDYKITEQSPFNGAIKKINHNDQDYFIGVANLKEGCDIYYPQAAQGYLLVMFNSCIYRFPFSEFIWPFRETYLCEKLHCSKEEAELVYAVVRDEIYSDAAYALLLGRATNNILTQEKL